MKQEQFRSEFEKRRKDFESLRTTIFGLISKAITEANVSAMPILSRVKDIDSAVAKFDRKKYSTPFQQMTDIVGFRVVLYLEHEIEELENVLRKYFEIDEKNSVDKRKPDDVQTVGYRSLHLICKLGKTRETLPEYFEACDFPFEVQVRTALEQAWAEIEHKQKYKSKVALPPDLQRRLNILSGNLELIDRELSRIVKEVTHYKSKITSQDDSVLYDLLSVTSLTSVTKRYAEKLQEKGISPGALPSELSADQLLDELSKFGILNIGQLEDLLRTFFDQDLPDKFLKEKSFTGLVRTAMISKNLDRFLQNAYWGQYTIHEEEVDEISKALKLPNLMQKFEQAEVEVLRV